MPYPEKEVSLFLLGNLERYPVVFLSISGNFTGYSIAYIADTPRRGDLDGRRSLSLAIRIFSVFLPN